MLGPFRDYNGGLLYQENEQLLKIKEFYAKNGVFLPYLDDLFYGIKPISMRAVISPKTGIELVSLFQKAASHALQKDQKFYIASYLDDDAQIVIVKTREIEWKNSLSQRVLALGSRIGCSSLEENGYLYLCFFQQSSQGGLLGTIQHELIQCQTLFPDRKKSMLRINFQGGDPPSLNPRLATDIHCHILTNFLFEGLTRIHRLGGIELAGAEKIDLSPCQTRYTIALRPAWWSNGEEVTAYQYERTWKKTLMATVAGSIYPDLFCPIKNARKAREKKVSLHEVGVTAKNAKTLCIELEKPCPHFLNLLAAPPFFPLFGETEEPSVFNGPFVLTEWKRDLWIQLSRNPFYWDSRQSKIGGIKIFMVRDPRQIYEMFEAGEIDLIGDPTSPLPPEMLKRPEIQEKLLIKQITRVFWIHFNMKIFPFTNRSLRRAMSLAINRKRLTERAFIKQVPHSSPLPPKYSSFQGGLEGDPKLARAYFQKALKELKIDRKDFPSLTMTHSDLSFEQGVVEEVRDQLKETLGIDLEPRQLRWSEFSSALERGDFQLAGLFRRDLYNNQMFYLSFFKDSPQNYFSLKNKKYENLLKQSQGSPAQIEQLLMEQSPVIPIINQRYLILMNDRVKGVNWIENGCIDLKEAWIDETDVKNNPSPFAFDFSGGMPVGKKEGSLEEAYP